MCATLKPAMSDIVCWSVRPFLLPSLHSSGLPPLSLSDCLFVHPPICNTFLFLAHRGSFKSRTHNSLTPFVRWSVGLLVKLYLLLKPNRHRVWVSLTMTQSTVHPQPLSMNLMLIVFDALLRSQPKTGKVENWNCRLERCTMEKKALSSRLLQEKEKVVKASDGWWFTMPFDKYF